jgi:hypothetical protein
VSPSSKATQRGGFRALKRARCELSRNVTSLEKWSDQACSRSCQQSGAAPHQLSSPTQPLIMLLLSLAIVLVALAAVATALRTPSQFSSSRGMSLLQQASGQGFFDKFAALFDFKLSKGSGRVASTTTKSVPSPPVPVISDATLVFGATGKAGTRIVDAILKSNRQVIVAARSQTTADAKFGAEYLKKYEKSLFIRSGVDVTDPATMTADLFAGVTQVGTNAVRPSSSTCGVVLHSCLLPVCFLLRKACSSDSGESLETQLVG